MKKLKHLNILGQKVPVVFKELDNNVVGLYYHDEPLIEISDKIYGDNLKITVLHEALHALWFRSSLNQTTVSHDVQEIICDLFAKVLVENFNIKGK